MSERVVIVQEEPVVRQQVGAMLGPCGLTLIDLPDGEAALRYLEEQPVDLVISDLRMPRGDAFELCRRIKAHSAWRYIPILVISAYDDLGNMVRSYDAGADDFLFKPLDQAILRARTSVLLRIRRQYRELLHAEQARSVEHLVQRRIAEVAASVQLSLREREVLNLLLSGYVNEEIAVLLGISARTAKFHTANTLRKLGIESRNGLLRGLNLAGAPAANGRGSKPPES